MILLPLLMLCLPAAAESPREAGWRATIRDVLLIPNPLPPLAARTHGHFEPAPGVTLPVAAWLERQLDFPNWRGSDIETMPVTHIGEWARREQVELDPLYASEHREGGTRALGTDVPGLSREQLSVFSEEEWRRQKHLLIHERWRELAKARTGRNVEARSKPAPQTPQSTPTSAELEKRDQPVTADDLRILEKAQDLLKNDAAWNRQDDRECTDDEASGKRSLFCALQKACVDVLGRYDHRRVALQEVRFAVEDATRGRQFEHRLRDFNNLPETRLADIRQVLRVATERVKVRLIR